MKCKDVEDVKIGLTLKYRLCLNSGCIEDEMYMWTQLYYYIREIWNGRIFQCFWVYDHSLSSCLQLIEFTDQKSFSLDTPVSSTNKTDRHDITEILLKVC